MFLLHFLPDSLLEFAINLALISGLALTGIGFFLIGWIPGFRNYKSLVQILGVVLLVAGVYWKGGYGVELEWRAKAAAFQNKVDIAAEQSKTANAEIQTKIVTKTKVIHDTKVVTKEVLKQVTQIIDAECKITPEAISVLNKASTRPTLDLSLPKEEVK